MNSKNTHSHSLGGFGTLTCKMLKFWNINYNVTVCRFAHYRSINSTFRSFLLLSRVLAEEGKVPGQLSINNCKGKIRCDA